VIYVLCGVVYDVGFGNIVSCDILRLRNRPFYTKQPIDKLVTTPELNPTVTFIIPLKGKQELLVEQIGALFGFSEAYSGFCEIVIVIDETVGSTDATLKLAELAAKLGKRSHPHVRTRIVRSMWPQNMDGLIDIAMNYALGQKMIVLTNSESSGVALSHRSGLDSFGRSILITDFLTGENTLEKFLQE
jgi:hypothetical protein